MHSIDSGIQHVLQRKAWHPLFKVDELSVDMIKRNLEVAQAAEAAKELKETGLVIGESCKAFAQLCTVRHSCPSQSQCSTVHAADLFAINRALHPRQAALWISSQSTLAHQISQLQCWAHSCCTGSVSYDTCLG